MGLVNYKKADAKMPQMRYDIFVLKTFRCGENNLCFTVQALKDFIALLFCLTASYACAFYPCLRELCSLVIHQGKNGVDDYGYSAAKVGGDEETE